MEWKTYMQDRNGKFKEYKKVYRLVETFSSYKKADEAIDEYFLKNSYPRHEVKKNRRGKYSIYRFTLKKL